MSPSRVFAVAVLVAATLIGTGLAASPGQAVAGQPDIVGGSEADQPYPFAASLQSESGRHFCGAALVAPAWLVTAAHCLVDREPGSITTRIGSLDRTTGGQLRDVAEVLPHPAFDLAAAGNDIGLVRLAAPVEITRVPLAAAAAPGTGTRLLGWGQTCPERGCGESPVILQQLDTVLVDGSACAQAPNGFDPEVELCTDNPGGDSGACYGDSGGPQVTVVEGGWRLVGVTSRAGNDAEACASGPSVYTSAIAYASWIDERVSNPPAPS